MSEEHRLSFQMLPVCGSEKHLFEGESLSVEQMAERLNKKYGSGYVVEIVDGIKVIAYYPPKVGTTGKGGS